MRKSKFLLAAALLAIFLLPSSFAAQKLSENERALFDAANSERAQRSLPTLQWDESLATAARKHANRMAFYNVIEHQLSGEPDLKERLTEAGARFSMIAENIAVAPNPETIHSGWMHSPGHRGNILNPKLTAVGIAAVRGSGGLFAVQDFSLPVTVLSIEQQERRVISLMNAAGMRRVTASQDARITCGLDRGISVSITRSVQAMRFEVSDLSKLPEGVEKNLRGQSFQEAQVGACRVSNAPGFAHYRVAILLF
jgi:cysteine-rich secretory family protein